MFGQCSMVSGAVRSCSRASQNGSYFCRQHMATPWKVPSRGGAKGVGHLRSWQSRARLQVQSASSQTVSDLPTNLKSIVGAFQMVPEPMARYKQLLYFATKLDPLPKEYHTEDNKVQGCVSQVWVKATLSDGLMQFQADSDSQLTKGLAALLVQGLSGCTPQEILSIQPNFAEMLGLKQSLTPSRNNGFLNMFKLMQRRTLELAAEGVRMQNVESAPASNTPTPAVDSVSTEAPTDVPSGSGLSVTEAIETKLRKGLSPQSLKIINQSDQHKHHVAMHGVPQTGETHFRIEVVSDMFAGLGLVKRHRVVFELLKEEMDGPVHALSLDTKAPEEVN